MRFFDDPGKALQQMEDELLEEDWEEDEEDVDEDGEDFQILTRRSSRPVNYAVDFDRTVYDDEETDDAYYAEDYIADRKSRKKQRKKGSGGLVLLLLGELAGIAGIIWWSFPVKIICARNLHPHKSHRIGNLIHFSTWKMYGERETGGIIILQPIMI